MNITDERLDDIRLLVIESRNKSRWGIYMSNSSVESLISATRRLKEVEYELEEHQKLRADFDALSKLHEDAKAERDALLCLADETDATAKNLAADNARLRRAVEMASGYVLNRGQRLTPTDRQRLYRLLQEALASTPEQSLKTEPDND